MANHIITVSDRHYALVRELVDIIERHKPKVDAELVAERDALAKRVAYLEDEVEEFETDIERLETEIEGLKKAGGAT